MAQRGTRSRRRPSGRRKFASSPAPSQPQRPAILEIVEDLLEGRRATYENDHDPVRVWEAYWLAAQYAQWGIAMPRWVSIYLERVASRFIKISRAIDGMADGAGGSALGRGQKALTPAIIAETLELNGRGRGTIHARRRARRAAQQLALDVMTLTGRRGYKAYVAIDTVASIHKVSRSTVQRAHSLVKTRGFIFPGGWESPPLPSRTLPAS